MSSPPCSIHGITIIILYTLNSGIVVVSATHFGGLYSISKQFIFNYTDREIDQSQSHPYMASALFSSLLLCNNKFLLLHFAIIICHSGFKKLNQIAVLFKFQ